MKLKHKLGIGISIFILLMTFSTLSGFTQTVPKPGVNSGTAVLLNIKAPNGGDLILVVDHQAKTVSLVEVDKNGALHVRDVLDYSKPAK